MVSFSEARLHELLHNFKGKRVAVVGDLMVDRYYWGTVGRISPEAPVPVVEVIDEQVRLGGAANVANNIQTLGGEPILVGLIGKDHPGDMFIQILNERNLSSKGVVVDAGRPTTIKTRVIAHAQHVVRIDNESKAECPEHIRHLIVDAVKYNIHELDAIIIEDYNKGVVTKEVIHELVAVAKKYNKIITVDPKLNNFFEYKGVTVFKPNRREVEEAIGGRLKTQNDVENAGKHLLASLEAENILITRGEEGMSLFESGGGIEHVPTQATNVQDVSGAGDTVVSTLTMALASGAGIREASVLANCAAGVVVASVGIVPILPSQLLEAAMRFSRNGQD
ncbi:D-glycero-beta-D-manno-heptose-7-phosphate kinase [Sphingobacteriales bacterium CHB3]|nr:D-glycero-beta-D-manno-heptose-7-phosphate kinase [Sphingobacteriales bacterium CHB3]